MKSIHVFAAELPTLSALQSKLDEAEGLLFNPLTDSQWSASGFNSAQQLVNLGNGYRIDFVYSSKDIPRPQIIEEVQARIEALDYEPTKEQVGDINDVVVDEFCIRMVAKTVKFSAYYHAKKQTLIFDCKEKLSQAGLSLLLKAVGSIETKTLHCSGISNSLTSNVLECLLNPSEYGGLIKFASFDTGDLLVMVNADKDIVRFKGDYPIDQVRELIEDGYRIKEINLEKDGILFTLNEEFKIKNIKTSFKVEGDNFDDKESFDRHVQAVELELMVGHCESLRNQFDKQNEGELDLT